MDKFRGIKTRMRKDFSKIPSLINVPFLLDVQTSSYDRFLQVGVPVDERRHHGLQAVFNSVFPIPDFTTSAMPSTGPKNAASGG